MNISATSLYFDESMMWVDPSDGRKLGVPLAYFPRLLRATPEQRMQYEMSGNGTGLHWEALDEDISVEGLLIGQAQGPFVGSLRTAWLFGPIDADPFWSRLTRPVP